MHVAPFARLYQAALGRGWRYLPHLGLRWRGAETMMVLAMNRIAPIS